MSLKEINVEKASVFHSSGIKQTYSDSEHEAAVNIFKCIFIVYSYVLFCSMVITHVFLHTASVLCFFVVVSS